MQRLPSSRHLTHASKPQRVRHLSLRVWQTLQAPGLRDLFLRTGLPPNPLCCFGVLNISWGIMVVAVVDPLYRQVMGSNLNQRTSRWRDSFRLYRYKRLARKPKGQGSEGNNLSAAQLAVVASRRDGRPIVIPMPGRQLREWLGEYDDGGAGRRGIGEGEWRRWWHLVKNIANRDQILSS